MQASQPAASTAADASAPKPESAATWWQLVKHAASAWSDDYAPSMGAALSYYTVFSLAPLLLIVISIAGLVFGEDAARGQIFGQLSGMMGAEAASAIEGLLKSVSRPSEGITGTAIGVGLLVVGATTVFGELQDALDRIWRAPVRDKSGGLWKLLRTRLLSFGMILGIAFLLMVSLVFGAVVAALGDWWGDAFVGWEVLAQVVNTAVGFALTTAVFAMIYKLMPRVHVAWRDVIAGAVVTSALFTIGKFLISLYIGKSDVASGFGAAGSLIVVFVWVYYSAQVFLMGAEFTWVYAQTFGSMRGVVKPGAAPEPAGDVPSRSDGSAAAGAAKPVPAPPTQAAVDAPRRAPQQRPVKTKDLVIGVGLTVASRVLLPWLLARLRRPRWS